MTRYITEDYLAEVWQVGDADSVVVCYSDITEKELFTRINSLKNPTVHLIVKGTVTDISPIEIDYEENRNEKSYGAIVELFVEKVYRGDCKEKKKIEIFVSYDFMEETNILYGLEIGDSGIFMPEIYNDQSVWENLESGEVLVLKDLADYEIQQLFVLLETEEGMVIPYEYSGIRNATTFEEVEEYIYRMVEKYPTGMEGNGIGDADDGR